jgi:hypothetical protein
MAHEYAKEAKETHERKLKSYGKDSEALGSKVKAKNWAGFDALNNSEQAGRAPLNSSKYIAPEVTPERVAKKKGGAVTGAQSLKRLDKSPRKSKSLTASSARPAMKGTGSTEGDVSSGTNSQVDWDPQNKFEAGEMNETSMRAKGGRMMHEDEREDRALVKKMVKSDALTGKKAGGRTERADGGKVGKGKTTVNILIGGPKAVDDGQSGMMPPMGMPMPVPAGAPSMAPPMAPPMGAGPAPMPGGPPPAPVGGPPQMPPGGLPMGRKDGGKVQVPYKKPGRKGDYPAMDFGSGSGFGRKQKIDSYGSKGPSNKDNY